MTPEIASTLQSIEARQTGGFVEPGGLASQALSAARRNSVEGSNSQVGTDYKVGGGVWKRIKNPITSQQVDPTGQVEDTSKPVNPMTSEAAARIQSAEARRKGGIVESGGFASRAQAAATRNVTMGKLE